MDALLRHIDRLDFPHDEEERHEGPFVPKLHVPSKRASNTLRQQQTLQPNPWIHAYTTLTSQLLESSIQSCSSGPALSVRNNCGKDDILFIRELVNDPSITIRAADKNLGLAIVDTSWYRTELLRMLGDTITYKFVGYTNAPSSSPALLGAPIHAAVQSTVAQFDFVIDHLPGASQARKFLKHKIPIKKAEIPMIYLLLKVHKPRLCGRPIVPCRNWITTPASVVLDFYLQPYLSTIPWLVKDSKSLVNELERSPLPLSQRDGLLLTADIGSLYTNIDTNVGLQCVRAFLEEQQVDSSVVAFFLDLLKIVMQNSYLSYRGRLYLQIDGTAMGTNAAPTYANIVVYMLERSVVQRFSHLIYRYHRYLDDLLLVIAPSSSAVSSVQRELNSLHPKLQFEFSPASPHSAAFLDLHLFKGPRFSATGIFDLRVHQKQLNLYLYISFRSFHTPATKRAFITTELTRYIRNSSSLRDYLDLKSLFYGRLRDRGYPPRFLDPLFDSIHYHDRPFFLLPARPTMNSMNYILANRRVPLSACLRRRFPVGWSRVILEDIERPLPEPEATKKKKEQVLVFITNYDRIAVSLHLRRLLTLHYERLLNATDSSHLLRPPIMAFRNMPSMSALLIGAKKKLEKKQATRVRPSSITSEAIQAFFRPKP